MGFIAPVIRGNVPVAAVPPPVVLHKDMLSLSLHCK